MLSQKEQIILDSIEVHSDNDPLRPEFPYKDPKFPATPTLSFVVPGFSNVFVKDESGNSTGTHKDRMAWEMIVMYRDLLIAKSKGLYEGEIISLSLISSGSAATAIQSLLLEFNLPPLKVLLDYKISQDIKSHLQAIGAEVYEIDLSLKKLNTEEILELTNNTEGMDITSSTVIDPNHRFYDWMSYEIVNESPDYCFLPYGSGVLFNNVLNVSKKEITEIKCDPRFKGDTERLSHCHFLGATTQNPSTNADKLWSPFLPFTNTDLQWFKWLKKLGYCGKKSGVYQFQEEYLYPALNIFEQNNIEVEPSGAAGLALLLQMRKEIPKNSKILIVSTGKLKLS